MSSEPPDALGHDGQDAESTPIMKAAGPAAVPAEDGGLARTSAPPGEADPPRVARTVPRPGGPISSRRPINAAPRVTPVDPSPAAADDAVPTERRPKITPLADPADDDVPGVDGFLAALAAAKQEAAPDPTPASQEPTDPGADAGAPKRRSRRSVKTVDEAPQSKARSGAEAASFAPEAPAEPVAVAVPATAVAFDGASPAATADDANAPGRPAPPRPAPPRPRAPAAPPAEESPSTAGSQAAPHPGDGSTVAAPAVETPRPHPKTAGPSGRCASSASARGRLPQSPRPPLPRSPLRRVRLHLRLRSRRRPRLRLPALADHIDDEASWDEAASAHPSRPPLLASVELETFVAPPPPPVPALSPGPMASPPPQAPPPKPPAVEEVEAVADEEEAPAAAAKGDEIVSIPDDELVTDRISEIDPISGHDEIMVDVEEPAPQPKKPPPPPKRHTSIEPPAPPSVSAAPVVTAAAAAVVVSAAPAPPPVSVRPVEAPAPPPPPPPPAVAAAPPLAAQTLDLGKKRTKPWWEEVFSDDFIRTLEKVEPKAIRKECDFIEERLGLEKGAVMLDLCCGNGAHAVELASRGYNVVGYDLSLAMLARAQDEALERGQRINFLQGDMREMAFDEAFDGMYSWSTSFGYFDDEKNLGVLSRIHRGLRKGGIFLLDVINRDYVCPRQPSLVWFEGDGCVCMDEMHVDFFSSRLRVKRTVMFEDGRSRECDYSMRLYGLHELGKMLHETGFKVLEVTGHPAHPGVFFGSESPRIIVLAERG